MGIAAVAGPVSWLMAACMVLFSAPAMAVGTFALHAEKVTGNIYALVGGLGPRTLENHALNATMGFVVTGSGVVLIDSGASAKGAELIRAAIAAVTAQPVKWVINTGVQDHRWLGNGYFAAKGAEIIALKRTVDGQKKAAEGELQRLKSLLKDRFAGTVPLPAPSPLAGDKAVRTLGGITFEIIWPGGAHFAGDAIVWLPAQKTVFAGDLVFMDRMLAIQGNTAAPSVKSWSAAFKVMATLAPLHVVPGHGHPGDLAKARRDTGDYLDWLAANIAPAVENMDDLGELVNRLADAPQFSHLKNYKLLQRQNVNRAYLQLEAAE